MNAAQPRPVIFSYGLGADSTAVLLRWLTDPTSRDFDLEILTVVTAMTGDEWPVTGELVQRIIVPMMREHGVRWIQAARSQRHVTVAGDGIVILDDSTAPDTVHLEGSYRLSDEMLEAGTIPTSGGARKCSIHAKGDVLDPIIAAVTGGQPYRHILGYEANELGRIVKDRQYNTCTGTGTGHGTGKRSSRTRSDHNCLQDNGCHPIRVGEYPLLAWGWNRAACLDFIARITGVAAWPKSACTYCPFALSTAVGRAATLERYATESVHDGVRAVLMEHAAIALNPRMGLIAGKRLIDALIAGRGKYEPVLVEFRRRLEIAPHAVYEVRRLWRARDSDPDRAANGSRSLEQLATGTRADMHALLADLARPHSVETGPDGIARVYRRRRAAEGAPGVEHYLVTAPAWAQDKEAVRFAEWWPTAITAAQQRDTERGTQLGLDLTWPAA